MTNVKSMLGCLLPVKTQHKLMMKLVKENYATGEYNKTYRNHGRELTDGECHVIACFAIDMCRLAGDTRRPRVLDIGCGDGALYDGFMDSLGIDVTGVDISRRQIEEAKKNCPNAKYLCGDFTKYNPKRLYDGITSFYSFYNLPRREHLKVLKRLYGMLRNGGEVLINVRKKAIQPFDFWYDWCGKPMAFSYYSCKKFSRLATIAGFEVSQFDVQDHDEYVWLLLKKQ